jgi:hypothetical protein
MTRQSHPPSSALVVIVNGGLMQCVSESIKSNTDDHSDSFIQRPAVLTVSLKNKQRFHYGG